MKPAVFEQLLADRAAKRAVAVVTRLADGLQALVHEDDAAGELALAPEQLAEVRRRLRGERSGALESAAGELLARC